ncbi:alpha/beta fold hydrolase [Falsiroseomonas sp.]|uniref:alpha/beta fold hydrolase n=1 Tax=Falsiroseomonas sp. TaxID=2870721 RepID=UPI0034A0F813
MTAFQEIGDLQLRLGGVLRSARLAYITRGRLAADGRNAVLLTHGYTSSHTFIEGGSGASEGGWSDLVGPGLAIDTDRFFVVSSNMLGSSFGSTAPRSANPATGRPYGPDFPPITLSDIVAAQRRLLDALGVRELHAVVGPSYGGFQTFTWGVEHPDFLRGLVAAVSGLTAPRSLDPTPLAARLAEDPNWNGGHYYDRPGGVLATMMAVREETLRRYGLDDELAPRLPDKVARDAEIRRRAREWAEAADAHSLLVLGRALDHYDLRDALGRIRASVLYVLSRTDRLFPPTLATEVMPALAAAGVRATYAEIDSEHGHLASGTEAAKWAPALRAFLDGVA